MIHLHSGKPVSKRDFERLAVELLAQSTKFPETCEDWEPKVRFSAGGFIVSCRPDMYSVQRMAEKIRKGTASINRTLWHKPRLPSISPLTDRERAVMAKRYMDEAGKLYSSSPERRELIDIAQGILAVGREPEKELSAA